MSQYTFFANNGSSGGNGIETITGDDGLPVAGSGSPLNVNLLGDLASGSRVLRTASDTETIYNLDATTTQKGVVLLPSQEIALNYVQIDFGDSPYVVTATDYFISVDSTGGPVIIQLPNSTTSSREFIIKDRVGAVSTNNITVTTVGGAVTIDGATDYIFTDNYESLEMLFNGTTYEIF